MDKQQAARVAFETHPQFKYLQFDRDKDAWGRGKYKHSRIQALWEGFEAAQAAIMPALAEARDAFRAIETTGLNNVCSGLDAKHVRDHNITVAQNALARLNSVIGDKK